MKHEAFLVRGRWVVSLFFHSPAIDTRYCPYYSWVLYLKRSFDRIGAHGSNRRSSDTKILHNNIIGITSLASLRFVPNIATVQYHAFDYEQNRNRTVQQRSISIHSCRFVVTTNGTRYDIQSCAGHP
jgi:hypothetical protein